MIRSEAALLIFRLERWILRREVMKTSFFSPHPLAETVNHISQQRSVQKHHLSHSSTGVKCINHSHHHTNNVWQEEGDFCLCLASIPAREDPDLDNEASVVLRKIISTSWSEDSCWESFRLRRILLTTTKTKVKFRKTATDSRVLDFRGTDSKSPESNIFSPLYYR